MGPRLAGVRLRTAWDTRAECELIRSKRWNHEVHACDGGTCPGVIKQESGAESSVWQDLKPAENEKVKWASIVFYCLPDTVDPRPQSPPKQSGK